jgi:pilus assembly protein Flp/PilA
MKTTAWKQIKNFLKDEEGATAVEYGLMVAGIAALIVLAVFTLGRQVNTTLGDVSEAIKTPPAAPTN